jgi:hypothetical protein
MSRSGVAVIAGADPFEFHVATSLALQIGSTVAKKL